MGLWQRAQLRDLLRLADGVMTSTEALAREVGGGAVHVPVAATITPIAITQRAARNQLGLDGRLTVALFGRDHESRALDYAETAIAAIARAHGADRLTVLNLGAGAPPLGVPSGVEIVSPGPLSESQLSLRLRASDFVLLPFTDGVSTRRTTLMAALAHGLPVLGSRGHNTDAALASAPEAIALTPAGDPEAFSRAAVELASDPDRRRRLGEAAARLYDERFDWPVIARAALAVVDQRPRRTRMAGDPAPSARQVTFVAHNVGGSGGMEYVSVELINRLLSAGDDVTVIARTCELGERDGLRFRRVPIPLRPFAFGYPAFFALASLMIRRRPETVLHTTGAIVANRADVSTVHYCHRAAVAGSPRSRASRRGLLYRLNDKASSALSLLAEAWCYRPARTRLLCAVSDGVAVELDRWFPDMRGAIRTVPNGVDSRVFRPDADRRRQVRAEVGVRERAALALFVGGDWQRKGLAHAIDALATAPEWHLAVAGSGDPGPMIQRARAAGTADRLHMLGRVQDMPRLYAAGDAFVLPTAYESFSLVTFEAAASGLPLLVTRVNGVEDLLVDGENGWFITRDGADIARRLTELRDDPERARRMAAAARHAAAGFSWDAMGEGYMSVYEEVAGAPR